MCRSSLNKKGFTLIEVLGVIVIIAVISLITVPIVTKVINDSKKNSFKLGVNNLVEAANNYYADKQLDIKKTLIFDFTKDGKTEDGIELSFKGHKPIAGRLVLNADGGVALIDISDGEYYANYDSTGDDAIIVTDTNDILTQDEITQAIIDIKAELIAKNKKLEQLNATKFDDKNLLEETYPVGSIYTSVKNINPGTIYGGTWVSYGAGRTLVGVDTNNSSFNTVEKTGGSESEAVTLNTSNLPSHDHYVPSLNGGTNGVGDHTHYIPSLGGYTSTNGNHNHSIAYSTGAPFNITHGGGSVYTLSMESGWQWAYSTGSNISTDYPGDHSHSVATYANNTGGAGSHSHSVSTNAAYTGSSGSGSAFNINQLQSYTTVYMWKRTA